MGLCANFSCGVTNWRSLRQGTYNRMLKFLENLKSTAGLPLVNIKYQLSHLSAKKKFQLALLMLAAVLLPHARAQNGNVLNDPSTNNIALKYVYGEVPGDEIQWLGYTILQSDHSVGHLEVHSGNQPERAASAAMVLSRNNIAVASLLLLPGSDNHTLITIQSTMGSRSANIMVDPIISSRGNTSGLKIAIDHKLLPNGLVATVYEARTIGHRNHSWNVNGEHFISFNAGAAVLQAHKSALCKNGTLPCRIAVGMSLLEEEMVTVLIIIDEEANVNHNVSMNNFKSVFSPPQTTATSECSTSDILLSTKSVSATPGAAAPQLNISAITIIVGVVAALLLQYSQV